MQYRFYKRIFDVIFAIALITILLPIFVLLLIFVKSSSSGPFIYWSKRLGKNENVFLMPKIRTMKIITPTIATHLLKNPNKFLTPAGSFLRRYSLDELPQIWSVLIGDMSFIGPRPALFNQNNLIKLRKKYKINNLKPGITGWAQINGRDKLSIKEKVLLDQYYLNHFSFFLDLKIIVLTIGNVFKKENISH